jgi:DnaK suppressor protein
MARQDALLRLHKSLLARRAELRKKLAEDLDNLRGTEASGDQADAALESSSDEMNSALAELDARELSQIDRALTRLKQGTYGQCEVCHGRIPVGRLGALPFCTLCIDCQREMEKYPDWGRQSGGDWEKVYDTASSLEEPREVNLADLEIDMTNNR